MMHGLGVDIAHALRKFKGQAELLREGKPKARQSWQYRNALRGWLAHRIIENGMTPILDVAVFDWRLDAVALRGRRIEFAFLLRATADQDFRPLLLFPSTVTRVLVALTERAVPADPFDLTVVAVPSVDEIKVEAKRRVSVTDIHGSWERGYRLAYGIECPVARRHRTAAATKLLRFWEARGNGRELDEFFAWFLARHGALNPGGAMPRITQAIDLQALAEFDARQKASGREYVKEADDWARSGGWAAPVGPEENGWDV